MAVWGCGPVGQFAIASAFMLGAARVIAIDRFPERLEVARSIGAITIDYAEEYVSVLTGAGGEPVSLKASAHYPTSMAFLYFKLHCGAGARK